MKFIKMLAQKWQLILIVAVTIVLLALALIVIIQPFRSNQQKACENYSGFPHGVNDELSYSQAICQGLAK